MSEPTIVALASPVGTGGVAVVRVSGCRALEVSRRVFQGPGFSKAQAKPESHRAVYGILHSPPGLISNENKEVTTIDQVLALPMLAPHSYTGEDTVEFFCHGGTVVAREVVEACIEAGAAPAGAGEFTRRAFLNGKLSLDQAEAVADLIHAESRLSARAAVRQVLGGLKNQLVEIERPLLDLLSRIEGSLEFADDDEIAIPETEILKSLRAADRKISSLLQIGSAGRLLRDGIHIVLAGAPNVGKSSLLNALADEDRAIVDKQPGTTRDVVSVRLHHEENVFVFHDTAGLRQEAGPVERKGIARTQKMLLEADLILHLEEAKSLSKRQEQPLPISLAASVENGSGEFTTIVIRVGTKSDLVATPDLDESVVLTSSLSGQGISDLWRAIDEAVAGFQLKEAAAQGVVLNQRHLHKLGLCSNELTQLSAEIQKTSPGPEVIGTLLSSITAHLGEVSGRVFSEQLLEAVFSRFCVGK
ncbi:MAG: tRNA uridine-5-carboxymethylaminomethyl(34) synthesis GTPase MnmE [Gemmatimonadales bacterium]|nr:tRNA uridine-5-carboxymethylaminomethyl(34) synthesis GTPase MnmE [Gemmatimonadales bacterium]